jgi:phosphatidate cytidylyltransferase
VLAATPAFLLLIALGVRPDGADGQLADWLDAGRAWLLITVLCVWADDTFAYFGGRLIGRGAFFNHISPNKTWSGAVAGGAAAVAAGGLLGWWVDQPVLGLGLGVLVALMAPIGDLLESALKRAAQVKDSGRLFPGHGGLLDRVDAFLLVAPSAWLYLVMVGLA